MNKCEICKKEIEYIPLEIYLDGTDDFYRLELCVECDEIYGHDYFEPSQVDKIIGVDN